MTKFKLTAPPLTLILAILSWIFGKHVSGPTLQAIGTLITPVAAAATASVHKGTVKKVVQKVKAKVAKQPKPNKPITMYDTIDVGTVPANPQAVAGYVGGFWPTYKGLVAKFPRAHHLSIAINHTEDADCLDVERGDATPDQVVGWVQRQFARGIKRPAVYASVSAWPEILSRIQRAGIPRGAVRIWTAHYTFRPHLCTSKCWAGFRATADMTQYTDKALGRNLDASYGYTHFFE